MALTVLDAFIADMAQKPFCWRNLNCGLELADWWRVNHGIDPAADLRGVVTDAADAEQLIADRGGLVSLVSAIATKAGAVGSAGDRPGDFGVIEVAGVQYCAILSSSGRWIVKAERGVAGFRDCTVLAAWSI
ncbi:hypothetical protein SAMN05892877_12713 [Rhizobium subbaraonis]|uniref:DUF6950 domain-containing protein n=1 Tax=Rhizobium subbaraonis TaxID=908946 RepID=A0A285V0H4_9HYPH|nr:hypothetical protein [Rhizobium subbaraonis]SOC47108.1 hypothetical protein SAMN05892877_12713 [Rhizobium subbaraonis]